VDFRVAEREDAVNQFLFAARDLGFGGDDFTELLGAGLPLFLVRRRGGQHRVDDGLDRAADPDDRAEDPRDSPREASESAPGVGGASQRDGSRGALSATMTRAIAISISVCVTIPKTANRTKFASPAPPARYTITRSIARARCVRSRSFRASSVSVLIVGPECDVSRAPSAAAASAATPMHPSATISARIDAIM
jgi:hypothetical protein